HLRLLPPAAVRRGGAGFRDGLGHRGFPGGGGHLPAVAGDAGSHRGARGAGLAGSRGARAPAGAARRGGPGMSMEFLMATGIGALTAVGLYLILMRRTFPVIIGLSFLSYAVNVFLFTVGRLAIDQPRILAGSADGHTDPLPQALVLTAIVITFGMTALIVVLSLRAYLETGTDDVGLGGEAVDDDGDDLRDEGAR